MSKVSSLKGVRRELVDIILMESTVAKATKILEPLADLGNLSRLSDAEVREAARVIMDQRDTRMGKRSNQYRPSRTTKLPVHRKPVIQKKNNSSGVNENLVPTPAR